MTIQHLAFEFELADGTIDQVRVLNPSLIQWDETRAKQRWADTDQAPVLWQTFIVWHALRRSGRYSSPFETFRDTDCVALQMITKKGKKAKRDAEVETVDPTLPAPEPDSSSLSD